MTNGNCACSDCATSLPVMPDTHALRLEVTDEWRDDNPTTTRSTT